MTSAFGDMDIIEYVHGVDALDELYLGTDLIYTKPVLLDMSWMVRFGNPLTADPSPLGFSYRGVSYEIESLWYRDNNQDGINPGPRMIITQVWPTHEIPNFGVNGFRELRMTISNSGSLVYILSGGTEPRRTVASHTDLHRGWAGPGWSGGTSGTVRIYSTVATSQTEFMTVGKDDATPFTVGRDGLWIHRGVCLLYTSPSPRDS